MSHNKMPHNNRVSSSVALKTNDMWSKTIGHDPYANMETESERKIQKEQHDQQSATILRLAKISQVSGSSETGGVARGACKKCGLAGHLTFQCMNVIGDMEKAAAQAALKKAQEYSSDSSSSSSGSSSNSDNDTDDDGDGDGDGKGDGKRKGVESTHYVPPPLSSKYTDAAGDSSSRISSNMKRGREGEQEGEDELERRKVKEKEREERHLDKRVKKEEKKAKKKDDAPQSPYEGKMDDESLRTKAGVEVDDDFAEAAWDESSMEVSRG